MQTPPPRYDGAPVAHGPDGGGPLGLGVCGIYRTGFSSTREGVCFDLAARGPRWGLEVRMVLAGGSGEIAATDTAIMPSIVYNLSPINSRYAGFLAHAGPEIRWSHAKDMPGERIFHLGSQAGLALEVPLTGHVSWRLADATLYGSFRTDHVAFDYDRNGRRIDFGLQLSTTLLIH